MNYKFGFILALLGLLLFAACSKENIDDTTTDEDDVQAVVVDCDSLQLVISIDSTETILTAEVFGGTAPYTYTWSTGEVAQSITISENGEYSVTAVDAEGCTVTTTQTIGTIDDCNGLNVVVSQDTTGYLTAFVSGGNNPFSFLWSTGETTQDIEASTPGDYEVTVIDALGCTASNIYVLDPTDDCNGLSIYISQDSTNLDQMTVLAFNGNPPFTYNWSTGEFAQTINVESGTTYSATVTDTMGCTEWGSLEAQ